MRHLARQFTQLLFRDDVFVQEILDTLECLLNQTRLELYNDLRILMLRTRYARKVSRYPDLSGFSGRFMKTKWKLQKCPKCI